MSWSIRACQREITAREKGFFPKDPGGRLAVALIWPGAYHTGMSALGFLSIYAFLNSRSDLLAERFFWPDGALAREYERSGSPLVSLESGRPLREFDLIAASLSLENDYWFLPAILEKAGLSGLRDKRTENDPPVLAGGVAVWANPWPVLPFVDLILTGEAEAQWPQLVSAWSDLRFEPLSKTRRLHLLSQKTPGALYPADFIETSPPPADLVDSDSSKILKVTPAHLNWPPPAGLLPPISTLITPEAEFSSTRLVEISRGCPYGCRFCLAGFIFRPHRPWPLSSIIEALGLPEFNGAKVGLISPAAADYPDLGELLEHLFREGRTVSLSSLRLSAITPELAELLAGGRLSGVAVAPEAGSQALRNRLNKLLDEPTILEGARLLAEAGLRRIKLYFMVGLPGELDSDLEALAELCAAIRQVTSRGKGGPELQVSLANFTPKAHTPFEEAPMLTEAEFRRRGRLVAKLLKPIPRLKLNLDPPLWSIVQGLLSRGGPESAELVKALQNFQGRLKPSLAAVGYTPDHPLHRPWPCNRPKPWRVVEPICGVKVLAAEKLRAEAGETTPPCPRTGACGRCSACTKHVPGPTFV